MTNSDEEEIMRNFGVLIKSSLITTFDQNDDDDDDENLPSFSQSKFLESKNMEQFMTANKDKFSLLSLNVDSINRKFPHISMFLKDLLAKNLYFSAICIQEARIGDDTDSLAYDLPDYKLEPQGRRCSEKGGFIIYVHTDYKYTLQKSIYKKSDVYEAL